MSEPSKHTHPGNGTVPGLHGEPIPTPVLGCPACATVHSIGDELGAAPEGRRMSEIVVPVREPDNSNAQEVRLALGAMLLGENCVLERVRATLRYRLPSGEVRFLQFGDEEVTGR